MTSVVRRAWLGCLLLATASCFEASTPQSPASDGTDRELVRRPGAPAGNGDLRLSVPSGAEVVTFGHREIPEDSCEMYEGCALGSGRRASMTIRVSVHNAGTAAIELGRPWESRYFDPSLCQQAQTIYGFLAAELIDADDRVAVRGSLSTNCVADRDGGYTCMAQGLGPDGSAFQPEGQCDYLDLTDLPAGDYRLRLTVNPSGEIPERDLTNNTIEVAVHYAACEGVLCAGTCCPIGVACVDDQCELPDLRINEESARESLWISHDTFGEDSCELEEQCVTGSGRRRLLNFEGRIENWGPGDLAPGPEHDNPLFEYSSCHDHYHFRDFTDYRLLDTEGNVVAQGHKQSFCLMDMEPVDTPSDPAPPGTRPQPISERIEGPWGSPSEGCNYLSAGWADIYGVGTPCQWVDITGIPAGEYVLQLSVNPLGRVAETALDNNTVLIPVSLPEDVPCVPEPEICGDAVDQDCDDQPDAWDEDCYDVGCSRGDPTCDAEVAEVADNHNCQTAFELVEPGLYGSSLEGGPEGNADCDGVGAAAYFRFTLERTQAVYLSAFRSSTDTVLGLYRGDCSAAPIRCADDDCGGRNGHFVDILSAGTYIAVLKAKHSDASGDYRLEYQLAEPRGARVLEGPGVYAGDTTNSGDDVRACGDFPGLDIGAGPDDVYLIAACHAPITLSTCGSTTFRTALEIRELTATFEQLHCGRPDSGMCAADELGATMTAYVYGSGIVFLTVDGASADDRGEYQLSVSY